MMGPLFKAEIMRPAAQVKTAMFNMVAETNMELTEKLKAVGAYPFWYSWHTQENGDVKFRAFGVLDKKEATELQWDDRAARIRIGLRP